MDENVPALIPIGDVVVELASPIAELASMPLHRVGGPPEEAPEDALATALARDSFLSPKQMVLHVPLELLARREHGAVTFGASLPRQPIVTTIMPVYHRLWISVAIDG